MCEVIVDKAVQTKRVTAKWNKAAKTGRKKKATGYTIVAMERHKYGNNPSPVKVCFLLSNGEEQLQLLKPKANYHECWLDGVRDRESEGDAGDRSE